MPERVINQIEILVHPDYHLIDPTILRFRDKPTLRKQWDDRINELAKNQEGLLLYFPAIPPTPTETSVGIAPMWGEDLHKVELDRQARYSELLGDRFWKFETWKIPEITELLTIFRDKNFTYTRNNTQIFAYGEYQELCVLTWREIISERLGIPPHKSTDIPNLCFNLFSRPIQKDLSFPHRKWEGGKVQSDMAIN